MAEKNITRVEIAEAIYEKLGLSYSDCYRLLDQVLDEITCSLKRGEIVKISSFGTMNLLSKRPRVGRNPKTGVEAEISARRIVSFAPSLLFKAELNEDK
ncbi:MAG: integration host factor subunit alpha [Alphaproteobacteria bacterium]|nr:integration host factor subunit alpha [Alphaproteobacteria bacterium]